MPGTKAGAAKTAQTLKERYGEDYYFNIGQKGGKAPHKGRGFQLMPRAKVQEAGRKGGRISRRRK